MTLDAATLRASWRAWWSPNWHRERDRHGWLQWVWTFVFNSAIAIGLTILAWGFARRVDFATTFTWNFVIAQSIGYTIHVLFNIGLRVLGADRIEGFKWPQRVTFYAGIPIVSVFIGYALGLSLLGVDVPTLVVERPNILVAALLLSLLMSTFWYRYMANKARLAEARAERERERSRIADLERLALDAQLRTLQAQIEPHFLFNTLANVVSLIDTAPAHARTMLERLIDLLRASLAASRGHRTTLGQECALVRAYLDILGIRMGGRLAFDVDVPHDLADMPVPPLSLQPLVENAIRHGLEPKLDGGRVRISARRAGDTIEIDVDDDGLGFREGANGGVGLANLRDRLAAAYGERARMLVLERAPGTRVRLVVPLEPE